MHSALSSKKFKGRFAVAFMLPSSKGVPILDDIPTLGIAVRWANYLNGGNPTPPDLYDIEGYSPTKEVQEKPIASPKIIRGIITPIAPLEELSEGQRYLHVRSELCITIGSWAGHELQVLRLNQGRIYDYSESGATGAAIHGLREVGTIHAGKPCDNIWEEGRYYWVVQGSSIVKRQFKSKSVFDEYDNCLKFDDSLEGKIGAVLALVSQ